MTTRTKKIKTLQILPAPRQRYHQRGVYTLMGYIFVGRKTEYDAYVHFKMALGIAYGHTKIAKLIPILCGTALVDAVDNANPGSVKRVLESPSLPGLA